MSGLAVVAIPEAGDPVWKLSSEKIPHLTLLWLGENTSDVNLMTMVDYVGHAADVSLERFGIPVDRRGTLGDEDADVLFFDKNYVSKRLTDFRSFLLKNDEIARLYSSADQYPEWTPHLTLGYPATPAKPDAREYPITWVNFDRIALWTGDYAGPEFRLEANDTMGEMSMSDKVDAVLAHYGIKGMKWGVRKRDTSPVEVSVQASPGKRVKTKGGQNQPASDDAKRVAKVKQKAKASTTDALSTKELQELVNRMNLEQQYVRLAAQPTGKGRAFVKKMFTNPQERKKTADNLANLANPVTAQVKAAFELGNDLSSVRLS